LKLTIGETSVFEEKQGFVKIEGSCVCLMDAGEWIGGARLVVAYCLKPGEKVRRISEEEYAVEY
jgi:hypothetical protein